MSKRTPPHAVDVAAPSPNRRARVVRLMKVLGLALVALMTFATIDAWDDLGKSATGARLARMVRSPQWRDGRFVNPEPLANDWLGSLTGVFHASAHTSPASRVPTVPVSPSRFRVPPASGLRVTWLGHSTQLVEIDGHRVLTDPVFSERPSPLTWIGPSRWFAPPIALGDLPRVDAVVISHDHYDHLDRATVVALAARGTRFVVPLGVGAHLEYWGVPLAAIVELDWWERTRVGTLEIVCTPARHASGRHLFDKDATLWAGYALITPRHRVYYSGDTGLFRGMREIGARLGPFDLTMIETGQYHRAWPDWHIGPEQAVTAHTWVRGRVMLPVHWGLFALAYHGWTEPVERVVARARAASVPIFTPRPGESVTLPDEGPTTRWWPRVAYESAAEHPIRSTNVD